MQKCALPRLQGVRRCNAHGTNVCPTLTDECLPTWPVAVEASSQLPEEETHRDSLLARQTRAISLPPCDLGILSSCKGSGGRRVRPRVLLGDETGGADGASAERARRRGRRQGGVLRVPRRDWDMVGSLEIVV